MTVQVTESSRTTKQTVNQQWSQIYWASGWNWHKITPGRERRRKHWRVDRKARDRRKRAKERNTVLTKRKKELRADKSKGWGEIKISLRERWQKESERKSYGEENCGCGKTETTLDRVSLLCRRGREKERSTCVCIRVFVCVKRAFCGDGGFAKQNWIWLDLLWQMTERR